MNDSPRSEEKTALALQVLLAEDNPVNQRLGTIMLESLGHTVVVAANGEEACSLCERQQFDVILMDIEMPIMNGEEATRRIRERENETGEHVVIIALSAHLAGDQERFLETGMDGFLQKPFKLEDLQRTLTKLPS